LKVPNKKGHILFYFEIAKNLIRRARWPEKAAGAESACVRKPMAFS